MKLSGIKDKLAGMEAAPMPEAPVGEEGMEMELPEEEAAPVDLAAISDDDLLAEVQKRGLQV
jgi:hypothetical protein